MIKKGKIASYVYCITVLLTVQAYKSMIFIMKNYQQGLILSTEGYLGVLKDFTLKSLKKTIERLSRRDLDKSGLRIY